MHAMRISALRFCTGIFLNVYEEEKESKRANCLEHCRHTHNMACVVRSDMPRNEIGLRVLHGFLSFDVKRGRGISC